MGLAIKLIHTNKLFVVAVACLSLAAVAVTLWWNRHLALIIDMVSAGTRLPVDVITIALVIMLVMGVINFIKNYLAGYACEGMSHSLRMGYARHIADQPFIEIEKLNAGEQMSRLQNEINGVSGYLNNNLFQLFDDIVRFIVTLVWLMSVNAYLTVASNLLGVVIIVYVAWSSKVIGAAAERGLAFKERMNRQAGVLIEMFPVIRLYDAFGFVSDGYKTAVGEWRSAITRMERVKAWLMSLSAILSCAPLAVLLFAGGHMAINGALSVGTLYIFINLSGNVSGVMMNMPGYITSFWQFAANVKRVAPFVKL